MTGRLRYTGIALTIAVALSFTMALPASAEDVEITPSKLPVSQARQFLGTWVLTVDFQDDPFNLLLTFSDIDGKLAATLQAPEQTQAQVITDITQSSLALKLRYSAQVAETETGMALVVRIVGGGTLTGSMSDEIASQGEEGHGALGLGLFAASVRGVKGGKIPGRSLMELDGNQIKVTFGTLRLESDDHKRFADVSDGEVFEFTSARATKFFTDSSLKFGDTIIKTENAGANYPGVYSLWLKKVGDGWNLVFNEHADVWGTMHESDRDVAEIPLKISKASESQKRLQVDLEEKGDGGVIRFAWGTQELSADFSIVQ